MQVELTVKYYYIYRLEQEKIKISAQHQSENDDFAK